MYWIEDQLADVSTRFYTSASWSVGELVRRRVDHNSPKEEGEPTYATQQLGVPQGTFSSMLGLPWNKEQDSLSITVPPEKATLTKRGILAKLAKIYGPLGLVLPETLSGKLIYRAVYDTKGAWDAHLSCDLAKLWVKWESRLPERFAVLRSLAIH